MMDALTLQITMLDKIKGFVKEHQLFSAEHQLLLAVSGGADSMVLLHLLMLMGHRPVVAHCNFSLRGAESDGDEQFVKDFCKRHELVCFTQRFDTKAIAEKNDCSIQEAARTIRYEWFYTLLNSHHLDFLLTAHHGTDQVETVFLNIIRGAGIYGLSGIRPKKEKLRRPLLFATSDEVREFAKQQKIDYRNDSSNDSDDYTRNKLRHQILPLLKELNPNLAHTIFSHSLQAAHQQQLMEFAMEERARQWLTHTDRITKIVIEPVLTHSAGVSWLIEILKKFGFNYATSVGIALSGEKQTGKKFFSDTHELLKDRSFWLIRPLGVLQPQTIIIQTPEEQVSNGALTICFEWLDEAEKQYNAPQKYPIRLDGLKLRWPLIIRPWKQGDRFKPEGMNGSKLISDYLIDKKLNLFEKEQIQVIEIDKQIAAIIGHRASADFCATIASKRILAVVSKVK
jgi:tRNA(Ile)-lysidine synthase